MSFCWLRDAADIAHFWTLRRPKHVVVATGRITERGLEFRVDWNGKQSFARLFDDEQKLIAFASETREALVKTGWCVDDANRADGWMAN